jgi:hypothetical protein
VPLLAFYMERKVTERVRAQLALGADAPPGPAATVWSVLSGRARRQALSHHDPNGSAALDGAGVNGASFPAAATELGVGDAPATATAPGSPPGKPSPEGQ